MGGMIGSASGRKCVGIKVGVFLEELFFFFILLIVFVGVFVVIVRLDYFLVGLDELQL
jgi:hypothetical protein